MTLVRPLLLSLLAVAAALALGAVPVPLFPAHALSLSPLPVLALALWAGAWPAAVAAVLAGGLGMALGVVDLPMAAVMAAAPLLAWVHRRRIPAHPALACFLLPALASLVEVTAAGAAPGIEHFFSIVPLQAAVSVIGAYLVEFLLRRVARGGSSGPAARPLTHQLFIVLAAVTTVLTMALGTWSADQLRQRQFATALASIRLLAVEMSESAGVLLDERARALAAFGRTLAAEPLDPASADLAGELAAYVAQQNELLTLLAADASGRVVAASAIRADLDVSRVIGTSVVDREYFARPMQSGMPYVSDTFRGRGFGSDLIVALSAPIARKGERPRGVIEASLNLSVLEQFLQSASARHGYTLVLTDRAGRVVASRGRGEFAKGVQFAEPAGAAQPDDARDLGARVDGPDRWMLGRATVPRHGWTVYVLQPRAALLPVFERQLRAVVRDTAIALGATFLLSVLIALSLARPLRRFAAALEDESERHLRDLPRAWRHAPREIRYLALAMTRAHLRQSRARRRQRELSLEKDALNEQLRQLLAELDAKVDARTRVLAEREGQLRSSETRWRTMAEIAPDAVIVIDEENRIVFANSALTRMCGHGAEALVGRPLDVLVPARHRRGHAGGLARYLEQGERRLDWRSNEIPVLRADGSEVTVEIAFGEFQFEGRQFFAGYLRDITARKQYEQALLHARDLAESANRSKDAFLATMSHEIRTPLHGLIGTLDLLGREGLSTRAADRLGIARNSARALLQIANDVLDLSGIEAGRVRIERVAFDLRDLVAGVVGNFETAAHDKGLQIEADIARNVAGWVEGDPLRVRQILVNLVNNSLKFTSQGGVTLAVSVEGEDTVFLVKDTGIGVPADKREHIFERFAQADDAHSRHFGGAGLGLAIARLLARAMGGDLGLADSGPGGSTFRLRLPLPRSTDQGTVEVTALTQRRRFDLGGGVRVLVVDDNPANRYVVEAFLNDMGAQVLLTEGADPALQALRRERFDIVLMDVQMPGMDGYQATREIRETLGLATLPVVAMTANANIGERARCEAAQMSDLLVKPFAAADLHEMLCRHLPASRADAPPAAARAVTPSDEPLLDTQAPDSIVRRFSGKPRTIQKLYTALQESIAMHLAALRDPLQQESEPLQRTLHALKGAAGMYGARRLQRGAAELEQAVLDGRPPAELGEDLAAVDAVGRQTLEVVRHLLEETASGAYPATT